MIRVYATSSSSPARLTSRITAHRGTRDVSLWYSRVRASPPGDDIDLLSARATHGTDAYPRNVDVRTTLGPVGLWTFQFDVTPWERARDSVAEIESLGYGAVWIPEAVGKDPFVSASLLLGASRRLAVATGI